MSVIEKIQGVWKVIKPAAVFDIHILLVKTKTKKKAEM